GWTMIEVKGISSLACFVAQGGDNNWLKVSQPNPGNVVDYVRGSKKYDETAPVIYGDHSRYWSGAFSLIPPGQKIRMTVDCVPAEVPEQADHSGRTQRSLGGATPDHFQFDMELVLATCGEDEDPLKAKDMALRNLTLDRVVLAKK